jgi:cell division septation protein DedD
MARMLQKALSSAALVALAAILVPLGADAQIQQEQQEVPDRPDREELTRFAHALIDVTEIQLEMEERLAQVQDADEAARIQQEANDRMVEALEDRELTPERYSEIAMLLNTDEELHAEFEEIYERVLEERDGDGPGFR